MLLLETHRGQISGGNKVIYCGNHAEVVEIAIRVPEKNLQRNYFERGKHMRRILTTVFLMAIVTVFLLGQAEADYIVDTGSATGTSRNTLGRGSFGFQYLAGQFTVDTDYKATITGIEGWMFGVNDESTFMGNNELTIVLYGNEYYQHPYPYTTFQRPDVNNQYYATTFVGPYSEWANDDYVPGWYGVDGLDWELDAGTYWVAFEVRSGQDFNGSMPIGVPDPMDKYAYYSNLNPGYYQEWTGDTWGFQIEGSLAPVNAVPIPGAVWLLGSGIAGLIGFRRKSRKG